jgi:hypothetical protein
VHVTNTGFPYSGSRNSYAEMKSVTGYVSTKLGTNFLDFIIWRTACFDTSCR